MASTEALEQFDLRFQLQATMLTAGTKAAEDYLHSDGVPVEENQDYLDAQRALRLSEQAPGYRSFGESLD